MKKKLFLTLALILASALVYATGPRSWGKSGTATITNATVTVGGTANPFGPSSVCVENTGTVDLYIDWTDGVATTTDDSTNLRVTAGKAVCGNFNNPNVLNKVEIGLIVAATTTTYNIVAIANR